MRSNDIMLLAGAVALALGASACKKKSGGGTGGGGGGAWLVGADGSMSNVLADLSLGDGYELGVDDDLLAITCRGALTAFVAGEGGTFLRTFDGGDSWETIDVGSAAALRDVAAAHHARVYVAGDDGLRVSRDDGDTWEAIAGADGAWRSIATYGDGAAALAIDAGGGIWRVFDGDGGLAPARQLAGARAIGLSHDGAYAAVAGDGGAILVSDDGGVSWDAPATGTSADLHAVWVTDAGEVIAVGAAGTVVHVAAGDVEVSQPGLGTLRAVHIDASGAGLAGGDAGELLSTDDGGRTWAPVELPLGATIFGLDSVEGEGHL